MSRESNDGHVCPVCDTTIYMEQCRCTEQDVDILGQPSLQTWLERCHAIDQLQQRLRATNDSRALEASNRNSAMLINAIRGHL